jgi:branched-chain amino acid transport system substrate-binding protein
MSTNGTVCWADPVTVMIRDDGSDPATARALYQDMIAKERVDLLFAPYSSLITEAVLPIAESSGIPILIAGAAADRLWNKGYQNAIGIYTPASKFTVGFLELLVMNDLNRIVVIYADDPFSVDLAESTRKWARRFDLDLIDFIRFKKGTADLAPLAKKIRDKQPQVVMVCGHMNEAVDMTRAFKQLGWRPDALYASVGPALYDFYEHCGMDADSVFGTSLWEPRANYPGANAFNQKHIDTYGTPPGYHAGLAYAAGQVLEKAVSETGSLDRDRLRDAFFHLDTMTIIGRFGVDKTGKQTRQHAFIIQWQNGNKELVWPPQIRTADPIF